MSYTKKILTVALIALLSIPMFGWIAYSFHSHALKNSVKKRFKDANTISVTLEKENLIWIKADKEILVDNKYFDVKKIITKGDSVIVTGYFDLKETAFEKTYQSNKNSQELNLNFAKLFFSFNYIAEPSNAYRIYDTAFEIKTFNCYQVGHISYYAQSLFKPPIHCV